MLQVYLQPGRSEGPFLWNPAGPQGGWSSPNSFQQRAVSERVFLYWDPEGFPASPKGTGNYSEISRSWGGEHVSGHGKDQEQGLFLRVFHSGVGNHGESVLLDSGFYLHMEREKTGVSQDHSRLSPREASRPASIWSAHLR